ncbi:DUF1028 domain-containing protein [Roseisolibacter sp. H3M3-2]|uniref:DUF1028 domain-containing protein n=1 Tax=Roseisolibacter sp. H3M3-2 TaxID=3031323 RepID=UPI0023DAC1EB|nr:DUF1028 domain-containing protein [Roseisolibacter sp. H3M3-2]MDF1501697.1 DUF1028 domain-containing protein [Roseisolibacter sp. H3M3-2]
MPRPLRAVAAALLCAPALAAQEPAAWGAGRDPQFATFSIAAVDPRTGETGVAVTTRVPCVGNGVPWVRAGVGAVATQANTRTDYGTTLHDALAGGEEPQDTLRRALAGDSGAAGRQVGVTALAGRAAQHTGTGTTAWAGHRAGRHFVTQGNLLVGPGVLEAVAASFEGSEGRPRHLADRLIDASAAADAAGGDAPKGRAQSAAVVVADPRPGRARGADGVTANINVCEHPEPVAELRRVYDAVSQTLGFRQLEQQSGNDVWQLKVMLHALGHFRGGTPALARDSTATLYTPEAVAAVDAFRAAERLATPALGSPPGLVDDATVERLWAALDRAGKADQVRRALLDVTAVRR